MKREPMSYDGRLKAAARQRKLARAGKAAVLALAAATAALWTYAYVAN